jgi:hypothetical protein
MRWLATGVEMWNITAVAWQALATTETVDAQITAAVDEFVATVFPIGSVVMRMDNIDPSTIYQSTTWALITGDATLSFGDGTAQAGTPTGDNDPAVPLLTHTHSMAQHTHTANHNHTASSTSAGAHTHDVRGYSGGGSGDTEISKTDSPSGSTLVLDAAESNGAHTHPITVDAENFSTANGGATSTGSAGEATPTINVKGAVISINVWERTA